MRIVLSAFGSRGVTRRSVALAAELRRRGHDVVLFGFPGDAGSAEAAGFVYVSCATEALPPLASPADLVLVMGGVRSAADRALFVAFSPTRLAPLPAEVRPVLAADEELAPLPPELIGHVRQVPAILPGTREDLPAEVCGFLSAGDPPVYLGFGAAPARDPDRLTRDLLGAVRGLGLRAIMERGLAGIGREGVRDVLVTDELPHAALFPRCAVVVHHGGPGTTALACRAGVPQIVVPNDAEQHYWADRVAALGLGEAVRRRHLTAASLHDGLRRALGDEARRFRAQVMAERLRDRDGVTEAADAVLA